MNAILRNSLLIIFFIGISKAVFGDVSVSSFSAYSENFNSLPASSSRSWSNNSTINGWYAYNSGATPGTVVANSGSLTTKGLKSFGSAGDADRALGGVNIAGGQTYYGIRIKNTTGTTIKRFVISYTLELWAKPNGNKIVNINFDSRIGATNLTSGTWTSQPAGAISRRTGGGYDKPLNGNATKYRTKVTFITKDIYLANGADIMFRWSDLNSNGVYCGIDDFTITPTNSDLYYSKSTGDLTSLSTWGTNSNGTGVSPLLFSNATFVIANRTYSALTKNWLVLGTGKVIVNEGTLEIPENYSYTGAIDVVNSATLTIGNSFLPVFGEIGNNSTIIFNGSGIQILPFANYSNLYIMGSGLKILSANTRIRKSLTFSDGKLQLGVFDLTLDPGATIAGANENGYVVTNSTGSLVQEVANDNIDVLFPVGTITYTPAKLAQSADVAVSTDNFLVKATDNLYVAYDNNLPIGSTINSKVVNRTWVVDEEVSGGSNISLTMNWRSCDVFSDFDYQEVRIRHFHNDSWDDYTTDRAVYNNGLYEITRPNITSFSPFGVFSGQLAALPVELLNFSARRATNGIVCKWETATEKDNNYFSVERSLNGREFTAIGKVAGAGISNEIRKYSFPDAEAPKGQVYYRLKQTDFNGSVSYSKVLTVIAVEAAISMQLYPNPATGIQTIQCRNQVSGLVQVNIRNAQGQQVKQYQVEAGQLMQGFELDLSAMAKGVYLVEVQDGSQKIVLRSVKQ
jgi:hypothetical protein